MQGIADIFLSFFYFPGPAYPQYLLWPFCRPPTASSGAAVPIADENRRCTQRSAVFRCRTGCGNGSEVSGGRFRHDFSRKNMTDNVLQEPPPSPDAARQKESRKPAKVSGFPYRIRRLFAQLGNRFLCGGHVVAGGHLFEGFDRLRLHLLGVVCRTEDEIDVALLGLVGLRSGGGPML